MRLLILGGTVFLGRAVARSARDAGHDVTCAARGTSGRSVSGVRFIAVDRDRPDGLAPLAGQRFDAVVDVARRPSHTRSAVAALADRVDHWCYVSSVSVYADTTTPGQRSATAPVLPAAPPGVDDATGENYGPAKVASEEVVRSGFGADRSFICRPGLVVGPEDPTGRFSYWVARLARGGRVLAPGAPAEPAQWVDVRDLSDWLVRAAERRLSGTFDGIGPAVPRERFLAGVAAGVQPAAPITLTWVPQDFLTAHDVRPWSGERALPLWLPQPQYAGLLAHDVAAALAAGLRLRPLPETAADTLAWLRDAGPDAAIGGLSAEAEADVLRQWDRSLGE